MACFTPTDLPGGSVDAYAEQDAALGDLHQDGFVDIVIADVLRVQFLSIMEKAVLFLLTSMYIAFGTMLLL